MQGDWKKEAVEQALQVYHILFRRDLDALGTINQSLMESVFHDRVRERLNRAGPGSAAARSVARARP